MGFFRGWKNFTQNLLLQYFSLNKLELCSDIFGCFLSIYNEQRTKTRVLSDFRFSN